VFFCLSLLDVAKVLRTGGAGRKGCTVVEVASSNLSPPTQNAGKVAYKTPTPLFGNALSINEWILVPNAKDRFAK